MKRFEPNIFFSSWEDDKTKEIFVQPKTEGIKLISQYLKNKYQANISCPIGRYSMETRGDYTRPLFLKPIPQYVDANNFKEINALVSQARKKPGDYREVFVLSGGSGSAVHAVFMVYIKEGDKEGILLSDSLGVRGYTARGVYKKQALMFFIHLMEGRLIAIHAI